MKRFLGNVMLKNAVTPTSKNYYVPAPGIWAMNEAMQACQTNTWPTQGFVAASQQEYTASGTYTWVAPIGVTSVSVVCVGAGGSNNGGGGELRWANSVSVTPGNSYTVTVGVVQPFTYGANIAGGFSQFINSSTCKAFGGNSGGDGGIGYGGSGGTGGGGGTGGNSNGAAGFYGYYAAGGGTGGYSGNGGNASSGATASAGNGGGGGGGSVRQDGGSAGYGGIGGGVGIYGQGASGAGGSWISGDYVSAYGKDGSVVAGLSSYFGYGGGYIGATGAVRIIWPGTSGLTRTFPSTNTQNL